ncbi:MAG: hypothetical protein KDI46_07890 [Alphaproteobacteria bacterium]|nr:hypothetical protein [Alphaproteobacteria bacterium]
MPRFLTCVLALALLSAPAWADDSDKSKANPVIEAYKAFTKDLGEKEARHFGVLYGNYNLIKVVEQVRGSVSEAIEACGKANPEMKDPLDKRFGEWKTAVNPILDEAQANIDNMMIAQDYAKKKDIKALFKLVDQERKKNNKRIERVPVSTPEACEFVLKQMDQTQEGMSALLRQTLVSLPQAMESEAQAEELAKQKKAEEEADAEGEQTTPGEGKDDKTGE